MKREVMTSSNHALAQSVLPMIDKVIEKLREPGAQRWLIDQVRDYLRRDYRSCVEVIDSARAGDELAHDALMREFEDLFHKGQHIPAALGAYHMRPEFKRPSHRPRSWLAVRRELGIVTAVYLVSRSLNLELTRSEGTALPSAASVVSQALRQRGITLSEKRIGGLITKWNKWVTVNLLKGARP